MMLSAKIAMRPSAPPARLFTQPRMPEAFCAANLASAAGIDAGNRDVGAEAVDDQRAEREPEALLQLRRLAEGATSSGWPRVVRPLMPWSLPRSRSCGTPYVVCRPETRKLTSYASLARRFDRAQHLHAAARLLDRRDGALGGVADLELDLGLDLAGADEAHAGIAAWRSRRPRPAPRRDRRAGLRASSASIAVCTRASVTSL